MKGLAITLALVQSLALQASAHAFCGFIPDHILQAIVDDENANPDARQNANMTIQITHNLRNQRSQSQIQGAGITTDDDDSEYPDEQNSNDAANLQELEQALEQADEDADVDPSSVETSAKRRRALKSRQWGQQSGGLRRFVYNKNGDCNEYTVGIKVRQEQSPVAQDDSVNSVWDKLGIVYQMYNQLFNRDSIDNNGISMHANVHFCRNFNNALWNGEMMIFGDGDGYHFTKGAFAQSLDVIGHEITHGVVQYSNPLKYYGQSGALNEHIADVFGILTKHWYANTPVSQASWTMGENLVPGGYPLRSMSNPGQAFPGDLQPATMAGFQNTFDDNGGVHINSGIPNHAFYLFAKAAGGNSWDVPGQIWYNVLTQGQGQFDYEGETFRSFAQKTLNAASEGYGNQAANALYRVWQQVGVL